MNDGAYSLSFNRPKDNFRINLPDGSSASPMLLKYDGKAVLKTAKDLRKPFPYTYSTFMTPAKCNIVKSTFEPSDYSNSHKSQIKAFNIENKKYIAYTKPSESNSLSTFSVSEISKNIKKKSCPLKNTVLGTSSKFYTGIDLSVYDDDAFALLLADDEFEIVKVPTAQSLIKSQSKRKIADAFLHKTLKNYFTLIENEGTIHVFNCERKSPCWSKQLPLKSFESNSFLSCQFGCHPQSLMVTCDENIISLDTRIDRQKSSLVFSLSNIGNSFENKICSTAFNGNPYIYVNCTNTVYLIDERYVKVPIMSWNHLLPSGPNYSDMIVIDSENILILGNSCDKEVSLISTKTNELGTSKPYIPETCLPINFHPIEDTLDYANVNGIWYQSSVKERFSSPCLGFSANNVKNDSFYLWTENVFGDISYQIYKSNEVTENDSNSKYTEESKIYMQQYQNNILNQVSCTGIYSNCCKIKLPGSTYHRSKLTKDSSTILISKDKKNFFWNVQNMVEKKRKTEHTIATIPLISEYKGNQKESEDDFMLNFHNYRKKYINSLNTSESNNIKQKLACTWTNLNKDENLDECTILSKSSIPKNKSSTMLNSYNYKIPRKENDFPTEHISYLAIYGNSSNSADVEFKKEEVSTYGINGHTRVEEEDIENINENDKSYDHQRCINVEGEIDVKDIKLEYIPQQKRRKKGF